MLTYEKPTKYENPVDNKIEISLQHIFIKNCQIIIYRNYKSYLLERILDLLT